MSQRRNRWYLLIALALLLAPFAIGQAPAQAANQDILVDTLADNAPTGSSCATLTANDSDCSLRQAIAKANALPAGNSKTISFALFTDGAIPISGPITLDSAKGPLPAISASSVTIEADLSVSGVPQIEIDGNGGAVGLQISGSSVLIKGLSLYGFSDSGIIPYLGSAIYITGNNNSVITCYIGVRPDGTVPSGGANFSGIRIDAGATGNVIGGSGGTSVANYISGNAQNGVVVSNSSGNFIQNNVIGLVRSGNALALRGNGKYGVQITNVGSGVSQNNLVGGSSSGLANIIGGNGQAGILLRGTGTMTTSVQANYIGIDKGSDTDFGNTGNGILIEDGASGNLLGGTSAAPLIISGNTGYGVQIRSNGTAPKDNTISGTTFIGTNRGGTAALPNDLGGILVDGSNIGAVNTRISGIGGRLLIAGNTGPGVMIQSEAAVGTTVEGALIGLVPTSGVSSPSAQLPNGGGGVLVRDGAQQTTLSNNTISGNTGFGVRLSKALTTTLTGNVIGLNLARTGFFANSGPGIDVQADSSNTLIGGASAGNYIAGNGGPAVSISGSGTVSTTVSGNIIGLSKSLIADTLYLKAAGNTGAGVLVSNGPQRTTIASNTIGNSGGAGVQVAGVAATPTTTVTLSLNQIGWTVTSASNTAEKAQANAGGVLVGGDGASAVDVLSNSIKRNTGDGVLVDGGARSVQVLSNTLTLNSGKGVRVAGDTQRVRIQHNRMTANGGGIELAGTTRKNGADADSLALPNHGIDPPIDNLASPLRIRVSQDGKVEGWVYTDTNTIKRESTISPPSACITCTIQFFRSADGASDGQGFTPLQITPLGGAATGDFATPNAQGFFAGQLSGGTPLPKQLLFVATDGYGNSSEFGVLDVQPAFSLNYLSPASGAQSAAPGQTITYILGLSNTGSVDFNNIELRTGGSLPRWTVSPANGTSTFVTLRAGQSRTYTVTMTLPSGADASVRFPISDTTVVTATSSGLITTTKSLVTTVLATPVLSVDPRTRAGSGPPGQQVPYSHRITNSGNVTVTLDLAAETVDPADSGKIWATSFSQNPVTIGPGGSADVLVRVTVPTGAQETDGQGNPVRATTFVTATARSYPVTLTFSDTTGVDLVPDAVLDGGEEQQAAAGEEIFFNHTVTNNSNGVARFKLNYTTNSGSTVTFVSDNGVTIGANNVFQLDSIFDPNTNKRNVLRFRAVVLVTDRLLPGDFERVNVFLTNADTGASIGGAAVIDSIKITASPKRPRIWMPFIAR